MENEIIIKVENLVKEYRVGQYGRGSLTADLQTWWAHFRKKEDPNLRLDEDARLIGTTFRALNHVSFQINKGDRVGIIGGNGAGKSTLLKLLCKITAPTDGSISYNGRIASMLEVGTGFNPEMTGRENIYMNGAILGMKKQEIDEKLEKIIEFSECRDFIDTPVKRYSSGMYVKLAFSVAAHLDSEIVIMDEVLAVGDMAFQKKCLDKMKELAVDENRTILYVSHNMSTIRELCNKCIVLDKGKVVFDGDVAEGVLVYSKKNSITQSHVELSKLSRRGKENTGELIGFEFIDKLVNHFEFGEKIIFNLEWAPLIPDEEYIFRIIIKDQNQNCVGMTSCNMGKKFVTNQILKNIFSFTPTGLATGKYLFCLELLGINSLGEARTRDVLNDYIEIEIGEAKEANEHWHSNYWGYIKFPQIESI